MPEFGPIEVLFVAGFGPIVRDRVVGRRLYEEMLNISFKEEPGDYLHTEALKGARSFALWPLEQAAQSCFGEDAWPEDTPIPQAWLEFDVEDVEGATAKLESRGYRMLVKNKEGSLGADRDAVSLAGGPAGRADDHPIAAARMSPREMSHHLSGF